MKDFAVSDYGIFDGGVSAVKSLCDSYDTAKTSLSGFKSALSDGTVFMGPICDSCVAGMGKIDIKITTAGDNFKTISSYLIETSSKYQKGDKDASTTVLSLDSNGKLEATPLMSYSHKGKTIYYNQKGYYDENGNLHQWETTWGKSIASSGCGPTSMAACLATMLGDTSITPSTIANMLNYDDNIGGNYVAKVASSYNLDQRHDIGLDKQKMDTFLNNGGTMIVAVNDGGHYIAVLGANNNGTYVVCDPNDFNTAQKTWNYNDIATGHTMVFHIAPQGKTVDECLQEHGVAVQV